MSELQEYDDAEEKRIIGGGRVVGEVNMDKPKPIKETQPETMPLPFKLQLWSGIPPSITFINVNRPRTS